MADSPSEAKAPKAADQRRYVTAHSVVKFTVLKADDACPAFHPGDVFYVRQHMLDTEVSSIRNFCYHTLFDLYEVYKRVRKGPAGGKEVFQCRDKQMVEIEVERLGDENASIGRAVAGCSSPLGVE